MNRTAEVSRKTAETNIRVAVNLDGTGQAKLATGIGFLDHMIDQIARHDLIDLDIQCEGDLHIDGHHTVEDIALVLGTAMEKALGDKAGLIRYLLVTAALATAFMVVKGFEYKADFHEHYVPGEMFDTELDKAQHAVRGKTFTEAQKYFEEDAKGAHPHHEKWASDLTLRNHEGSTLGTIQPGQVQLFLCFYYIMTGIHGIHIIVGIGCILWLVWEAWRGTIPPENYSTVEVVSLYWHLVDAIWLFLMPLLYLAGAGYGAHN